MRRFLWLALMFLFAGGSAPHSSPAQYLYLDSNGDGQNTAADNVSAFGITTIDVWLMTDRSADGSAASCTSGEAELSINSYSLILQAVGGSVAWGEYTNLIQEFDLSVGSQSDSTEFYAGYASATILPPGAYHLGRLAVSVSSGNPSIGIAPSTALSGADLTAFGSQCPGVDFDNTLKLGLDWSDVAGLPADPDGPPMPPPGTDAPTVEAPTGVVKPEGALIAFTVGVTSPDGIVASLAADLNGLPQDNGATFLIAPDSKQGAFSWTPTYSDAGIYQVTFTASAAGGSTSATTTIQVVEFSGADTPEAGMDPLLTQSPIPLSLKPGAAAIPTVTLSGTIIRSSQSSTAWYLYPGACVDRESGSWSPRTTPVADSLNTYPVGTTGGYGDIDRTVFGSLWHVVSTSTPSQQRPVILNGSYSLWCGEYDPNSVVKVGYPNGSFHVLYVDTGFHQAAYALTLKMNLSVERDYDFVYLFGGGGAEQDPLGNTKTRFEDLATSGTSGDARRLVTWTGSISQSTPGATQLINTTQTSDIVFEGSGTGDPQTLTATILIGAEHRALYFVLQSDDSYSSQDGGWPLGTGFVLDDIATSDHGVLYAEGPEPGGEDPFGGPILSQTPSPDNLIISARLFPGVGIYWQVVDGAYAATSDFCSLQKSGSLDHMFFAADVTTKQTLPGQFSTLTTCTFPLPQGIGTVRAKWNEYLDLPIGYGFVQRAEYRVFRDGAWGVWKNTRASNAVLYGVEKKWIADGDDLPRAAIADSIQLRFGIECLPALTSTGQCSPVTYGVLYDDLSLEVVTGTPLPTFGIFPSALAQSTFVDGTMTSRIYCGTDACGPFTCSSPPCWPGIRGGSMSTLGAIHDNVNSPLGDSMVVAIVSALRPNGMGMNWHHGFSPQANSGTEVIVDNAAYQASVGAPMMIYRLFDPLTKTWSPFDSTELDADRVVISGGTDTTLVDDQFRVNWPPRDKVGVNLPGGFTINGHAGYGDLRFLPRGTRLQYYFKAVDIAGSVVYQFQSDQAAHERDDLPTLPGGSLIAPDIIEFDVLPRFYPSGHVGTPLAARVTTPLLYLDGTYTAWEHGTDPVLEALRGMGVRADRYRLLQGVGFGAGIGGRELPGQAPRHPRNYFPNILDYGIADSLADWYSIIIESTDRRGGVPIDEADARLLDVWWLQPTGTDAGDRCLLLTGDDAFKSLAATPVGETNIWRQLLMSEVFGVGAVGDAWNGTVSLLYPTIEDRFANPASGPSLVSGYTYPIDGGCPTPKRFDALTLASNPDVRAVAFYPAFGGTTEIAGVSKQHESEPVQDNDRAKALAYGYSIGAVRLGGIPTSSPSYPHVGVTERMRVIYKFLTGCRGNRTLLVGDTLKCWPCPTDPVMNTNWATSNAFETERYGLLYPIQDYLDATAVAIDATSPKPSGNRLVGNFPNPFNPTTTIRFSSSNAGTARIRIFNVAGRLLRTLRLTAIVGSNDMRWDGCDDRGVPLASGIYFYRIRFPDGAESASRMTILK